MAFEGNTVEPAAGNGNKIQQFGPGHHHVDFRRGQGARIVQTLKVDLDQAGAELARVTSYPASRSQTAPGTGSPSGAQWEHPRPGRPHGAAARQEDPLERARYGQLRTFTPSAAMHKYTAGLTVGLAATGTLSGQAAKTI